jgi:hypothetical protein
MLENRNKEEKAYPRTLAEACAAGKFMGSRGSRGSSGKVDIRGPRV